jgi:hypothetical protein
VGVGPLGTTGSIIATNDIIGYYSSDERLKENLKLIQGSLDKMRQIGGYEFDWIPTPGIHVNEGRDVGVIAQQIEKILPEVVTTRDNGYKAVKYEKIVALLIEGIKDLHVMVLDLHKEIEKIKNA